jgi:hypothetical protein
MFRGRTFSFFAYSSARPAKVLLNSSSSEISSCETGDLCGETDKGGGTKKRRPNLRDDWNMPVGGLQPGAQVSDDDSDSTCVFFMHISFVRVTNGTC